MNRLLSIALVCLLQVSLAVASAFKLNVEVTPGGSGSLNSSGGTYEEGSSVYLRTYGNTGYVFKGWYEGETLLSSSASFNYTMPSKDAVVQARYEFDPAVPGNPAMPDTTTYYSFTAQVSPIGAGSLNTTNGRYAAGATVNLRAYINTGYQFVGWQNEAGETLSSSVSYNYTMPRHDSQLTALYLYDPTVPANPDSMATRYTVTIACKPVGGGTFNTTSATAEEGGNVRLYAYTNTGFRFLRWENEQGVSISTEQNFYYVIPHGNSKVYGIFEYDPAVPSNPNKNYWNKELGEIIVDDFTPGRLGSAVASAISGSNRSDVAMITVAGRMNDNDFGIANDYTNCILLDLSRVAGITQVPSYAFDYTNLETVYIPASIEKIGYRAFYECKHLSSLIVYAMTPPTLENNVFTNVPEGLIVYVPASSIAKYQEADGWKDFTILPIQEDIRSLSISLPEGTNLADYTQMWLELTNTKSGQRMHYVMTDRTQYTFTNIICNTSWNVTLRNERGDVFGLIENVEVKDEDVSVVFTSLSKPQSVVLSVLTPDGQDVTNQTQITWIDVEGNYLAQGTSLTGLSVGYQVSYHVVLPQELAMAYNTPQQVNHVLTDDNNNITCQLCSIPQVQITGKVKDVATGLPLSGVTISASQTFGGKYSKTLNAKTDGKGVFTLDIANVPTSLAFAASDYISQTLDFSNDEFNGLNEFSVPDVSLKSITGATISLGFTYTTCEGETQDWFSDYNNVSYTLYNITKQRTISQYNVQYPQIVLLEEVDDGNELQLTATSRTNAFKPVQASITIAEQKASATFDIVELGKICSVFQTTGNATVVGSLYDEGGKLLKTYNYSDASLTISDLGDGNYTLVSMGSSRLFNTIYDLAQLPQTGLVENVDYVLSQVLVKSGTISTISIDEVPIFDESKLYYTGDNTSFTVNKPSIVVGNYLTLTGRIDFKPAYATSVSNVQMIVDLPESCEFVENSVMVGNSTSSYTLNGNRITISMTRFTDRVRFCIIPTIGGEYAPSAFAQFDLNGETMTQPIGSANYAAKDLSISVPSTVAKTTVPISGTAIGKSDVEIYDNDVLIGQTTSLANGNWSTMCELHEPYNFSTHSIYAKVITKAGLELQSETVECLYNYNAIEVKTVTMINTAHPSSSLNTCEFVSVFDFQNNTTSSTSYNYWPSYPNFTFIVDFTNNDTAIVKNVFVNVFTDHNDIQQLEVEYNDIIGKWVAVRNFPSDNLPINVSVNYEIISGDSIDNSYALSLQNENIELCIEKMIEEIETNMDYEVVNDGEDTASVNLIHSGNKMPYNLTIKTIDYNKKDSLLSLYYFICSEDDSLQFSIFEECDDSCYHSISIDEREKFIYEAMLSLNVSNNYHKSSKVATKVKPFHYLKNMDLSDLASGMEDMLGIERYVKTPFDIWAWINILETYTDSENRWSEAARNALSEKCKDSLRLSLNDLNILLGELRDIDNDANLFREQFYNIIMEYKWAAANSLLFDSFLMYAGGLVGKAAGSLAYLRRFWSNPRNKYFIRFGKNFYRQDIWRKRTSDCFERIADIAFEGWINNIKYPEFYNFDDSYSGKLNVWAPKVNEQILQKYARLIGKAKSLYKKCKEPAPPLLLDPPLPSTPPINPIHDPSGYVYEGVVSNRIEGVTTTAFYKETVEDMYGDLHESIVKWDATEYAQENPLFTDEYGMYAWDVPQGLWQVKFEKEGYETTFSEWLPVPPPQLDINIAMKQNRQPEVKAARAFEDAVEVEFDKYMMPELLTTENIMVMQNGTAVEGTVGLLNEEPAGWRAGTGPAPTTTEDETFASKIRFNAAEPFTEQEITLMVNNRVKSYAGIRMQDNYEQTFTIEQEIKQIACDSLITVRYGDSKTYVVSVLPASATVGKILTVKSSSPMILSVKNDNTILGEDGKAEITITGELPGIAALLFSVEGTDITATTIVSVEQTKTVATPTASITSGTVVEKSTEITLSCATEGATIYYTLDGSCPCDETGNRIVYDGTPIIINESVTIKVMAAAPDMYESDVAEFVYTIDDDGIEGVFLNSHIRIYPLPVHDILNVTAGGKMINSITVASMNGMTVASVSKQATKVTLDACKLPAGIYIINVLTEDSTFCSKILKVD